MRKLFALLLITGFLASCTSSPDPAIEEAKKAEAAAKAMADEHIAVVKKYLAAFETGDFESWREICTDDFITYGPQYDAKGSLDDYISNMEKMKGSADSVKFHTTAILAQSTDEEGLAGDYVLWWGTNSGYYIPAEKSFKLNIHTVFKMEDGKIAMGLDYWDTGDLKKQLSNEEEKKKE